MFDSIKSLLGRFLPAAEGKDGGDFQLHAPEEGSTLFLVVDVLKDIDVPSPRGIRSMYPGISCIEVALQQDKGGVYPPEGYMEEVDIPALPNTEKSSGTPEQQQRQQRWSLSNEAVLGIMDNIQPGQIIECHGEYGGQLGGMFCVSSIKIRDDLGTVPEKDLPRQDDLSCIMDMDDKQLPEGQGFKLEKPKIEAQGPSPFQ